MPRFWIRLLRLFLEVLYNPVEAIWSSVSTLLYTILVQLSWFKVDSFSLMIRWCARRRRGHRPWCLFRSCFRNWSPVTVSNVIGAILLGFCRHFRDILVYSSHNHHPRASPIARWGVDHDLDSVTALMVTDYHSRTGPIFVLHGSILSLWIMCRRGSVYSRHEPPNISSPHRRGSWKTVLSPQSFRCIRWSTIESFEDDLEDLRICVHNRAANFLAPSHWSEVFCSLWTILLASHGLRIVLSNKCPCTFWTSRDSPGQLVAHIRYCSVNTELIDGNDCAKNPLSYTT